MTQLQKFLLAGYSLDDLKEQFRIKHRRHFNYNNLILFTYDIGCSFEHQLQLESRGIILDESNKWNCVSRSFDKFFNIGEPKAAQIDWNTAVVQEKLDGSCISCYQYDNKWQIATTGTPDGNVPVGDFSYTFAELFWETLEQNNLELPKIDSGITLIHELCTEYNKIVVPHQGLQTYFVIARDTRTGNYIDYEISSNFKRPRTYSLRNLNEILQSLSHFKGIEQEGYVVVDANYNRVKIKHPEYVVLHHAATGTTFTSLVELALKGEVSEAIAYFPHLTEKLNALQSSIEQQCLGIDAHYKLIKDLPSRKDFAMEAIKTDYSSVLFKMKDRNISAREVLLAERIPNIIDILKLKG